MEAHEGSEHEYGIDGVHEQKSLLNRHEDDQMQGSWLQASRFEWCGPNLTLRSNVLQDSRIWRASRVANMVGIDKRPNVVSMLSSRVGRDGGASTVVNWINTGFRLPRTHGMNVVYALVITTAEAVSLRSSTLTLLTTRADERRACASRRDRHRSWTFPGLYPPHTHIPQDVAVHLETDLKRGFKSKDNHCILTRCAPVKVALIREVARAVVVGTNRWRAACGHAERACARSVLKEKKTSLRKSKGCEGKKWHRWTKTSFGGRWSVAVRWTGLGYKEREGERSSSSSMTSAAFPAPRLRPGRIQQPRSQWQAPLGSQFPNAQSNRVLFSYQTSSSSGFLIFLAIFP
ncbi:uncharacterized protein EV420DRAFT_1481854 [Desarmillaria tabescens]|uniref:Uncharacterized protein n=1 Tax=Armillaria tabescens TaxID=1929756 RepID=A0AA39K1H3_ARMTA|nr:uncharacterized protein EV420DRAFT_1481854 [Desarmillaria tabescens]KAK0452856.1 hypothetical protein EV420DRAFT_1481854 [Desarmillaria tabescens]